MSLIEFKKGSPEAKKKKEKKTEKLHKVSLTQRLVSFWRYKVIFPIIYSKKIPIPIVRWHRLYKRINHLFRMFYYWDELEELSRQSRSRAFWDTQERRDSKGLSVFNNLHNRLNGLKLMMEKPEYLECYSHEKSRHILMFKGRYCQHIREYRGISRKKLCTFINAHYDIPKMDNYASKEFFNFYPISPKFLADFEEGKLDLMKYKDAHVLKYSGGFAVSFTDYGFPYDFFLEMVSKICCVHQEGLNPNYKTEYDVFKNMLSDYSLSTIEPNPDKPRKSSPSGRIISLKPEVKKEDIEKSNDQ